MNTIEVPKVSSPGISNSARSSSRRPLGRRSQNIQSAESSNSKKTNASKAKLPTGKPPRGGFSKLSSFSSASFSENVQDWTEKRCSEDDSASKASCVDSSDELCREDDSRLAVFRDMADFDDREDMMVLKRANPVYDSDDEDFMAAPSKRQRTSTSSSMVLSWSSQVVSSDPSGGFSIRLYQN